MGTKSGEILIYDVASSALVETISAHTATVWSIHVRADEQALVSGSADKDVKFWEIEQKAVEADNVCLQALCEAILVADYPPFSRTVRNFLRLPTYGH